MLWYVALVALLNLGLGYGVAVYLGASRGRILGRVLVRAKEEPKTAAPAVAPVVADVPPVEEAEDDAPADIEADAVSEEIVAEATAEQEAEEPAVEPGPSTDPITGLVTRDYAEQMLAELAIADSDPTTLALMEVDWDENGDQSLDDRLLRGIAHTVRQLLAEAQTAARYSDKQILVMLPNDDVSHATLQVEKLRQRIAATEYIADGRPIPATVTCALATVSHHQPDLHLLEFLQETLEEAKRYGGNRTFMHDGQSPAPVVPPEIRLQKQRCAI